jgi:hypothetical protein
MHFYEFLMDTPVHRVQSRTNNIWFLPRLRDRRLNLKT